ncbi:unnamed protein product [Oppiella nova]|uniref:Uncharacterized protein n=1 Tax=Oppiella nova TaxID=334625 RepID=A0A7R9L9I3_9ACAR|nr:unnamed protein product [Oppiella nova]CAG2159959.1 unnamed protein product [Oppiella nova]
MQMHIPVVIEITLLWLSMICFLSIDTKSLGKYSLKDEFNDENNGLDNNLWLTSNQRNANTRQRSGQNDMPLKQQIYNHLFRMRRKFPEIDSKGFDEDVFDEGFGDFSTMKKRKTPYNS